MEISTEELKAALQKQTDTFNHVAEAIQLGLDNQTRMGISVQNIEGKINGGASFHMLQLEDINR
jgi:chemotaxis receptor (MCP) glutamine deamidase CheD